MLKHKKAIRRHETTSQVLGHITESGHTFDFDNVRVIDRNRSKGGRLLAHSIQLVQPLHRTAPRVQACSTRSLKGDQTGASPAQEEKERNERQRRMTGLLRINGHPAQRLADPKEGHN